MFAQMMLDIDKARNVTIQRLNRIRDGGGQVSNQMLFHVGDKLCCKPRKREWVPDDQIGGQRGRKGEGAVLWAILIA